MSRQNAASALFPVCGDDKEQLSPRRAGAQCRLVTALGNTNRGSYYFGLPTSKAH